MTPTPEQQAIVSAARDTSDNLLISALAGAAKTSTLVLIAEALPSVEILCLAFNKKIAEEMKTRLPSNCTAMTLNSLGHRVWGEAIGRRLSIDSSKTYNILNGILEKMEAGPEKSAIYDNFSDIMKTIDFGKSCGWIPDAFKHPVRIPRPLMDDAEFFAHLDEELPKEVEDLIIAASLRSLEMALAGECDYADQILMPAVFPSSFPRYSLVLVDEAQDLSALNHRMLTKLVKKRLIAVGDPCQAIYGFRGAHEESMAVLRETFDMRELTLSVSFRCPIEVVKHAQWRAPHMRWPDWAKPGEVRHLSTYEADDLPDNAAVICRNNSPLFAFALKLLKNGRYAEIVGNDIGKALVKQMKKLGKPDMSQALLLQKIAEWEEEKLKKARKRGESAIRDKAECMKIFARHGKNLSEAVAYADHIFTSRGPLKLMTGHKSKGLEFPNVFFLDEHLVGDEGQDRNLRYVIITRAKETLTYIQSQDFASAA